MGYEPGTPRPIDLIGGPCSPAVIPLSPWDLQGLLLSSSPTALRASIPTLGEEEGSSALEKVDWGGLLGSIPALGEEWGLNPLPIVH